MTRYSISQPVRQVEAPRLMTGQGRFTDDNFLDRQTHGVFLRSPHAHAIIRSIDTTAAAAMPGVLAVLTGADLAADGIKPIPPDFLFLGPIEVQKQLPDIILLDDPLQEVERIETDVLVLGDDRASTDLVQALAARIPGMRGIYAGRLRNAHQVEAMTANLISMNRRYKAHAGLRVTDV